MNQYVGSIKKTDWVRQSELNFWDRHHIIIINNNMLKKNKVSRRETFRKDSITNE